MSSEHLRPYSPNLQNMPKVNMTAKERPMMVERKPPKHLEKVQPSSPAAICFCIEYVKGTETKAAQA